MSDGFDNPELNAQFQEAFAPPAAPAQAPAVAEAPMPVQSERTNVLTPEGELKSIPSEQVPEALNMGYELATQDHVDQYEKEQKYGGLGQQAITALEGAASAATFGLSTGIERTALGVNKEDIEGRREVNPGAHAVGQVAGLVGSALLAPEISAAGALERAGAMGAEAIFGAQQATTAAKVGSMATKAAIENMVFQSGDEVSKMLAGNPNQSAQTAIADIGLSGIIGGGIGGALGVANPLWKAAMGSKTAGTLKAITDKLGGIEGVLPDHIDNAAEALGVSMSPEVKAALSQDPVIRGHFETLQKSTSASALEAREAMTAFKNSIGDGLAQALGKAPEELGTLVNLSENEVGNQVKDIVHKSLKELSDPVIEKFEKVKDRFKEAVVAKEEKAVIGEQLAAVAKEQGLNLSADAEQSKFLQRVLRDIPGINTLEDLRKYSSLLGQETSGIAKQELWQISKGVRNVLREAEDRILTGEMGAKAPELLETHAAAKAQYKDLMNKIDALNDRLHVGPYRGPGTFLTALKDMDAKDVLSRLSPKNRVEVINELKSIAPSALEAIRGYHADSLLKAAVQRAAPGENISSAALIKTLDKMSPEMRNFVLGPNVGKFDAVKTLMAELPKRAAASSSALASLEQAVGSGAAGLAGMLMGSALGHNPAIGGLIGMISKTLGRDMPDAVRLGLIKFLGSDKPIQSEGFKAMIDYIHAAQKGYQTVSKSVNNVFKAGREVLPASMVPSAASLRNLDKALLVAQEDPDSLIHTGGMVGHYMPDHTAALAQTAASVVNYVNSQRPNTTPTSPLDAPPVPSHDQKGRFNQILTIAQQPLTVLEKVKTGSVTPDDVAALQNMYPDLYAGLKEKLMAGILDTKADGKDIPYSTRMGLSLFMAQPLDSTMAPASIMAAQPPPPPPAPIKAPNQQQSRAISKMPNNYLTGSQALEERKNRTN